MSAQINMAGKRVLFCLIQKWPIQPPDLVQKVLVCLTKCSVKENKTK